MSAIGNSARGLGNGRIAAPFNPKHSSSIGCLRRIAKPIHRSNLSSGILGFTALMAILPLAGLFSARSQVADGPDSVPAESKVTQTGANEDFIAALKLREISVGPLRVFYGAPLADKLDAVGEFFSELDKQMAAERKQTEVLRGRSDEIIGEVNRLVGWEPPAEFRQDQERWLELYLTNSLFSMIQARDSRVFLVPKAETKQYLRDGGSIPGMSYDPVTDQAHINFGWGGTFKDSSVTRKGLVILPIDDFDDLSELLKAFQNVSSGAAAFHELVEFTILKRLTPSDPFFRWFSDGFANAVTELLLRKYVSAETENAFADLNSVEPYQDLKPSLLLRYWPGEDDVVKTSFEPERRLRQARYNYATLEMRRLIERHGDGILKKTLDLALEDPRKIEAGYTTSDRLLQCLQRVTGEDLEARFREYQPFRTLVEGLKRYQAALQKAEAQTDHPAAFLATLRLIELERAKTGQRPLKFYIEAVEHLDKMGNREEALRWLGEQIMQNKAANNTDAARAFRTAYVKLAVEMGKLEVAEAASKELLAADSQFVPGLYVRMEMLSRQSKYTEARRLAEHIIERASPAESNYLALAQFTIGSFYAQGFGAPKDMKQARDWIGRSATNGLAAGERILGRLLLIGEGGSRDPVQAVEWLTRAANQGDAEAHRTLGVLYTDGTGVGTPDNQKALAHTMTAANKGDVTGQANLAKMYYLGRGTPKDFDAAFQWGRRAAFAGESSAQHLIGVMYSRGEGAEKDLVEAYKWMTLAADAGVADAKKLRGGILGEMSAAELARGVRELQRFKAKINAGRSSDPSR